MDDAIVARRAFRLQFLWVAVGIGLELLLIPDQLLQRSSLFSSVDFYYALLSPIVIWWFFHRLIPSKEQEVRELGLSRVRLLNLILGFYAASGLRATLTSLFSIHLGMWSVNTR